MPLRLAVTIGHMLIASASGTQRASLLLEAQLRASSNARIAFTDAVALPSPRAMRLACCLAAEETPAQSDAVHSITTNAAGQVSDLAETARKRLQLASMLGSRSGDPASTAVAVSTTLFGSSGPGSRDDEGSTGFFKGSEAADYYDPKNSFLDQCFVRRTGIPISLSLIYMEVCEELGLPLVGLNAPTHLLLAPADCSLSFVVDPFDGGRVYTADEASVVIARNAGSTAINPRAESDPLGATLLQKLRAQPMDSHTWCARMLRNLRAIYSASGDAVGIIGSADRLLAIGAAKPTASSPEELLACRVQVASAVVALRWEARRDEAKELLEGVLASRQDGALLVPAARRQLEALLADEWFA